MKPGDQRLHLRPILARHGRPRVTRHTARAWQKTDVDLVCSPNRKGGEKEKKKKKRTSTLFAATQTGARKNRKQKKARKKGEKRKKKKNRKQKKRIGQEHLELWPCASCNRSLHTSNQTGGCSGRQGVSSAAVPASPALGSCVLSSQKKTGPSDLNPPLQPLIPPSTPFMPPSPFNPFPHCLRAPKNEFRNSGEKQKFLAPCARCQGSKLHR